ncbi:Barstar, RNAse (barnase) inhibitor [Streptoalloteichus tenebrarius]|uniref:Barstar, RNAse (Barnase) inhibitor n=1 Tax=Streptoalloteichus tenebrarius (strain ATCC 17920 / DSM 40477 / JCM 4838 / CBS 697.72 / NBRC 16177 / NCIMB 11028 / NRRL B-12390 / A12253. 1 / ISP 5477) TaxID=1933 RepID=A0ABT1HMB7_STRSD|nr:barstar family protein [Streptoalloteichus tenebrarius]MCP2256653.1 Barstar, RNAse (barnase) inhibitor [Streptoalloteichus tenebrarius]BFF05007.1 hypothetical protein GCM10020241_66820 [Streptoalloteichus tenebrarius]
MEHETDEDDDLSAPRERVVIDLADVTTSDQLHRLLRRELGFPLWYGRNWDAFWDAITGLTPLPLEIVFEGWQQMRGRLPEAATMLQRILDEYNEQFGIYPPGPRVFHYR